MRRETVWRIVTCYTCLAIPEVLPAPVPDFKDKVITPEKLGLPNGNVRISEPVYRVYLVYEEGEKNGKKLPDQPTPKYPFTPPAGGYVLKSNEAYFPHYGVDITTRPKGKQSSEPMDYKSGVHGIVTEVGGVDPTNPITVKLENGTTITYRHSSKTYVKPGDKVTPDTVIAKSGDKGAGPGAYHVHIEANDKNGKIMHPDQAFQVGERKPTQPVQKSELGGVLVNPVPKKEDKPLDPGQAEKILQKRPDGTSVKSTIKLPKGDFPK